MTVSPFDRCEGARLVGPIDARALHPVTVGSDYLTKRDGTVYIPRAIVCDAAGVITITLPDGTSLANVAVLAGPNPLGGMAKITAATGPTYIYGVE